ncbi:MAG: GatB/YqeY domain-containing protein [Minisyncoccia bacterium]
MSLHQDIKKSVTEAMKARDQVRLNVLRGLLSAFTNEAVAKKRKPDEELSDDEALTVISRGVKQRKDSIEQFSKGGRSDLADSERAELKILENYLPKQMSREEILAFVTSRQKELNITDLTKKNQFLGTIMKELKGKTDGSLVKEIVDLVFSPDFSQK